MNNASNTMQTKIHEFNQGLAASGDCITIVDYVKNLNKKFFNIDLDFIDDFIDFVGKDEYIIHHNMLDKYEVLKISNTGHVKRMFEQHDFEEGKEYICKPSNSGYSLDYFLKPKFFKIILIRSKSTKKYAQYYLFLEEAIFYYNQYEKLKLQNKINEINQFKLLRLEKGDTLDNYVIVRDDRKKVFKYAIIRGSTKNLKETLHELDLSDQNIILRIILPHAMNFNKKIKEQLKDNFIRQKVYALKDTDGNIIKKWKEEEDDEPAFFENEEYIVTCNRWFLMKDISEKRFIEKISEINDTRFEL